MGSASAQQGRGLSVRQLTFLFFVAVAVCAVFFALGFLAGANRRSRAAAPTVEQVPPPGVVPPPVNAPPEGAESEASASKPRGSRVIEQDLKPTGSPGAEPAPASSAEPGASAAADHPAEPDGSDRSRLSEAAAPALTRAGQRGMMVQVAALRTEQDARSLLAVLKSRGYRAVVISPNQAREGDNLYRVQVGPFENRARAAEALHKLSAEGFTPFIRE